MKSMNPSDYPNMKMGRTGQKNKNILNNLMELDEYGLTLNFFQITMISFFLIKYFSSYIYVISR